MKISIDISPEEARKMMGLPDIEPLQQAMMQTIQAKMDDYFANLTDPEALFKSLMPLGTQAMHNYQNFFQDFVSAAQAKKD